jgi:hypothetical protein
MNRWTEKTGKILDQDGRFAQHEAWLFNYILASCCTVLFNGYCRLCFRLRAALLCFGFHCLSLHVSAYMAIFRCVEYLFSYVRRILLRCFFWFAALFSRRHPLYVFHLCFLCCFSFARKQQK